MKCHNCSKEIPESAKVCGYCGTKLEQKQKHTCPDCGKEIPANAKVCGYCGAKLAVTTVKTEKPAPVKKVKEPKVQKKTAKPVKEARAPKVKREPIKLNIPKWAFRVIGVVIIAVLALVFILPKLGGGSGDALPFSGKWVGDIHGTSNDFTATVELEFDKHCSIGGICGSYKVIDAASKGDLELISATNNVFKFLEHAKADEKLAGSGYQSMRLIGKTLHWSFEQKLPSGELIQSTGSFFQK